jgi:phosphoribosylglycinamide formyltransferase-1
MKNAAIVVVISGNGSNLQALIDAQKAGEMSGEIKAVISNRPNAFGLERAKKAAIQTAVVDHTQYPDRDSFDAAMIEAIDSFQPDLVILAGFMRILTDDFVEHYRGRMLNVHPSLLPKFRGLNTHQRAIDAGEREHGVTIHFVTPELDGGPLIIHARTTIRADDNAQSLAERVQQLEHRIYPLAVDWFACGRLKLDDDRVFLDDSPLDEPIDYAQLD